MALVHLVMSQNEGFLPEDEDEELFFDSVEDFPVSSNSSAEAPKFHELYQNLDSSYQVWLNGIGSVQKRREKLFRSMGIDLDLAPTVEPELYEPNSFNEIIEENSGEDPYAERAMSNGESTSSFSEHTSSLHEHSSSLGEHTSSLGRNTSSSSSTLSSLSRRSSDSHDRAFDEGTDLYIKNMDSGVTFVIDEVARDGSLTRLRELGSNQTVPAAKFFNNFGSSQFVLNLMHKEDGSSKQVQSREKNNWLRRLGIRTHVKDKPTNKMESGSAKSNQIYKESVIQRVKSSTHKKHCSELSDMYMCQDFKAHDGAILTMKFSPDGKFLATGGEYGILHVWRVIKRETNKGFDYHSNGSSSVYFTINENYQIIPLLQNGEKDRSVKWHGSSTCVVIPERVFGIEEEPWHDLRGHLGDVLDISWSKTEYLLSASADKSVRLWHIGSGCCLKVFPHKNYVTCIQFNPSNEDYFMTGSIDGIVRIWDISSSRVVSWIQTKEILTAICFHPDGRKAAVGTMTGQCQLYDISDNQLELKSEISLQGKRKSPHKRVTSLEFCPHDSTKLMVASADSSIRILEGSAVILKYKGLKNHGNHVSASFTRQGNHIISCTDNSVYLLNSASRLICNLHTEKDIQSSEHFIANHTSVAVPWNGAPAIDLQLLNSIKDDMHGSNGKATWPEEKLSPGTASPLSLSKSQSKFLKVACQSGTDTWGQVVVTAGWDGRIKSYQNFGLPVQP